MSLATICVPTVDRPKLLEVALRSALGQTVQDITVLVGDNGNRSETAAVIASLDDDRIVHVVHQPARSMIDNWVWMMNNATTPFVGSLHDDDQWEPTFLETTIDAMQRRDDVAMVFTGHTIVDEHGDELRAVTERREHALYGSIYEGLQTGDFDALIRLAFVDNAPQPAYAALLRTADVQSVRFPPQAGPVYDLWLTYQLIRAGRRFWFLPDRLTRYRVWPGSATQNRTLGESEDWLFHRVINEECALDAAVRADVQRKWDRLRFSRAISLADHDRRRLEARRLFQSVGKGNALPWPTRCAASLIGSSDVALAALARTRRAAAMARRTTNSSHSARERT